MLITGHRYRSCHCGKSIVPPPATGATLLPALAAELSVPVGPALISPSSLAGEIQFPANLDHFFNRLQEVETGDNQQTVRILQFGDAATAGDIFTGRMRSLFQQKYGNGGAGFTYAGQSFAGYSIAGTRRSQSAGWVSEGIRLKKVRNTDLGLGGVAQTSTRAGDTLSLDAPCSVLQVQYLNQPGGGAFSVLEDGRVLGRIATDDAMSPGVYESACTSNSSDKAVHHFELVAESSHPVRVFGTVTERPGITYESLGLDGADASVMLRWNQFLFSSFLNRRAPALIVLAYSASQPRHQKSIYESYSEMLSRLLELLHATVPEAAILVIGPPDRAVHKASRRSTHRVVAFDAADMADAQRQVCRTENCAHWDLRARMGGAGSMDRWVSDDLAKHDHIHFTSNGYVRLADFFFSDLAAAYDVWKAQHVAEPTVVQASSR